MFGITNKPRAGRRMLGAVACVGVTLGITACQKPTELTCKQLSSNPAALGAMAKEAMANPAFDAIIRPKSSFGGGGMEGAAAPVDEGGLTNEFTNQVKNICQTASSDTQPYDTALANTKSFAQTGNRVPPPPTNTPSVPSQSPAGANSGSGPGADAGASSPGAAGSGGGSGGSSGGAGSSEGAGSSGMSGSGCGGCSSSSGSVDNGSSGAQSSGSQSSGSSSGGTASDGASGSGSNSSGSSGSSSGASAGGSSSSSQANGNQSLPPCGPPNCNW